MQNDFIHIYTGLIINTVQKCLKRYQPTFYKLNRSLEKKKKNTKQNKAQRITSFLKWISKSGNYWSLFFASLPVLSCWVRKSFQKIYLAKWQNEEDVIQTTLTSLKLNKKGWFPLWGFDSTQEKSHIMSQILCSKMQVILFLLNLKTLRSM